MSAFFLNLTRVLEQNARVYWSIIIGILACLLLYLAEIIHIQQVVTQLNTQDQTRLAAAIEPMTHIYHWLRIVVIVLMLLWSSVEYSKTKKQLAVG